MYTTHPTHDYGYIFFAIWAFGSFGRGLLACWLGGLAWWVGGNFFRSSCGTVGVWGCFLFSVGWGGFFLLYLTSMRSYF